MNDCTTEKGMDYIMYNKSELKERGWTEKLIRDLLPPPIEQRNPRYACAAPMKLWDMKTVHEAEEHPAFIKMEEGREKRQEAALKRAEAQREKTEKLIRERVESIQIPVFKRDELRKLALEHKESMDFNRGNYDSYPEGAEERHIHRWEVNYLRHCHTDYDAILCDISGKIGKNEATLFLQRCILDKIQEVYPFLKSACEENLERMIMRYQCNVFYK